MLRKSLILFGFLVLFTVSIQAQNNLSAKDLEAIKNIRETYRTAWLKNDEEKILSLFTDDATLYPNGNSPVKGKAEMRKFWFSPWDTITTISSYEITVEDINGNKNYAALTGSSKLVWTMENKSKNELKRYVSNSYFISVYVKRGKDWKIFKQFWSGKTEEIK